MNSPDILFDQLNRACYKEICGDGILTINEECDLGNSAYLPGCTSSCTI